MKSLSKEPKRSPMNIITGKVPIVSKIAYGMGDASSTLLHMVIATYLTFFYTDVAKLSAAAVGTMMLVAQIVNMVSNPVLGFLVDQTHSKRGKSRPWFLVDAVPLGLFGAITFLTPSWSAAGRLGFAYFTYIGYLIFANMLQIPMGAILSNMTTDPEERTTTNSWRMVFGQSAAALSALITVPLVDYLGQGNNAQGYFRTAVLYGIVATASLLFCYFKIHENVLPEASQPKSTKHVTKKKDNNVMAELKALLNNKPLYLLIAIDLFSNIQTVMTNTGMMYYLKYTIHNVGLMPTLSVLSYLAIFGILLVPRLRKHLSNRSIMLFGYLMMSLGRIAIVFSNNIVVLYVGMIVVGFFTGFSLALLYAMVADAIDYGEYRTGKRISGFTYSLTTLAEGIGMGLTSAFVGYILAWGGYVGDAAVQTASALTSIKTIFLFIPLACTLIIMLLFAFYDLDKKMPSVTKALKAKAQTESNETQA